MTIQSDHDMRNPTDMIVLDRIAKALFRIEGIAMVQSITRPLGSPIAHSLDPLPGQHGVGADHPEPAVPLRTGR